MEQFPQIVSDQLSEIVEDRIYPLVEHVMVFFGFGSVHSMLVLTLSAELLTNDVSTVSSIIIVHLLAVAESEGITGQCL